MNRDPLNKDCTRDPIYLLQIAERLWTKTPEGLESDGESFYATNVSTYPDEEPTWEVDDWILPFLDAEGILETSESFYREAELHEGPDGWPMIYTVWRVETVFLTRKEAEDYAKARSYRWDKWRVYCVPCEGTLAKILNEA